MEVLVKFGSHHTKSLNSSTVLNPSLLTSKIALADVFHLV